MQELFLIVAASFSFELYVYTYVSAYIFGWGFIIVY